MSPWNDYGQPIIVGPNGGCAQCYHDPCVCDPVARKRMKSFGMEVELPECPHCGAFAVVRGQCLKCDGLQIPYGATDIHR